RGDTAESPSGILLSGSNCAACCACLWGFPFHKPCSAIGKTVRDKTDNKMLCDDCLSGLSVWCGTPDFGRSAVDFYCSINSPNLGWDTVPTQWNYGRGTSEFCDATR